MNWNKDQKGCDHKLNSNSNNVEWIVSASLRSDYPNHIFMPLIDKTSKLLIVKFKKIKQNFILKSKRLINFKLINQNIPLKKR